jgi:hypothetical protein
MQVSKIAKAVPTSDGKTLLEVAGQPLFQLNAVSATIWDKLVEGQSADQIISQISTEFAVPIERVTNDVNGFVAVLRQNDLVKEDIRTLDYQVELVWNKGIASLCDWRIPDEFPKGLGYASVLEPLGHSVPPYLLSDLIQDPEVYRDIKDGDLVWVRFSWVKSFLKQVLPVVKARFILVTADCPLGAPLPIMGEALEILEYPNVIHWYAQDCNGPGFMGRMSPLPLGIDFHTTSEQSMWGEDISSPREQEQALLSIRQKLRPVRERIRKVYIDFAWQPANRYLPGKRQRVIAQLLNNECVVFQSRALPRRQLWKKWGEYAFVLSPHGDGLDCHRTWEALACGNIVLVPSSPLDCLYEGLPVIPIKDWSEITPRNLDAWLESFHGCEITEERLTNTYWVNQMRARANKGTGA